MSISRQIDGGSHSSTHADLPTGNPVSPSKSRGGAYRALSTSFWFSCRPAQTLSPASPRFSKSRSGDRPRRMDEGAVRHVLGDLTNSHFKRPFQLDLEKFENRNKRGRYTDSGGEEVISDGHLIGGVENTKGKDKVGCALENPEGAEDGNRRMSFLNVKQHCRSMSSGSGNESEKENVELGLLHCDNEAKLISVSLTHESTVLSSHTTSGGMMEDECSRHSFIPYGLVPTQQNRLEDSAELDVLHEHLETDFSKYDAENDGGISKLSQADMGKSLTQDLLGKAFSGGCSTTSLLSSSNLRMPEELVNAHGVGNTKTGVKVEDGVGSEKACSCSFCLKAAFIWTDLHYQDVRGRLAALKKSRRHARSLDQRFHNNDYANIHGRDNSDRFKKIEFDLMQHCRSLFGHTEGILSRETALIHSTLLKLKDLKENCKRDLEMLSGPPLR